MAQAERAADGLPIYDERLGAPRSRLIDIDPPSAPASPSIESPATAGSIALRLPAGRNAAVAPPPENIEPTMDNTVAAMESPPPPTAPDAPTVEDPVLTGSVSEAVPEAEPVAPARPEPVPEPTATAAVESPTAAARSVAPATPGTVSVLFPAGGAELPGDAESQLDSVAATLGADAAVRLQLKAYADGADGAASAARRLSLSRALAVRGYLIDAGVSSTRIDVRALGSKFESGPADRVDVISVK